MGAVISTNYTKRYPQHVQHLLLVGPAGVKESDEERLRKFFKKTALHRFAAYLWNTGLTPLMLLRALPGEAVHTLTPPDP